MCSERPSTEAMDGITSKKTTHGRDLGSRDVMTMTLPQNTNEVSALETGVYDVMLVKCTNQAESERPHFMKPLCTSFANKSDAASSMSVLWL